MARRWHAQHCLKTGELAKAIVMFQEALAISPMYPDRCRLFLLFPFWCRLTAHGIARKRKGSKVDSGVTLRLF
jgi:hypothetical protein